QLWSAPLHTEYQGTSAPRDQQRALAFVRDVATLLLEGQLRPEGGPPVPLSKPVPRHASVLLDRLLGVGPTYETVAQLQADLAATRNRPTHVTRPLRAGHLAVLTACLAPGLATMLLMGTVPVALKQVRQSPQRIETQNQEKEAKQRREQGLPPAEPIAKASEEETLTIQEQNVLMLL